MERDCRAICFAFQMEFRSGDQLAFKMHCFSFSVLLTVCLSNEKCNLVSEFIYTFNTKAIRFQGFSEHFLSFSQFYPIVFSICSNSKCAFAIFAPKLMPVSEPFISHIVVRLIHNASEIENFMKAKHSQWAAGANILIFHFELQEEAERERDFECVCVLCVFAFVLAGFHSNICVQHTLYPKSKTANFNGWMKI